MRRSGAARLDSFTQDNRRRLRRVVLRPTYSGGCARFPVVSVIFLSPVLAPCGPAVGAVARREATQAAHTSVVKSIDTPRLGRAITIVPASWRSSPASPAANGSASSGPLRMMQGRAELAPCATRVVRLPLGVNGYRVAADSPGWSPWSGVPLTFVVRARVRLRANERRTFRQWVERRSSFHPKAEIR
jgi:hypothetical protein